MEESFLPTVRTLMNAPATSPLAEVDINNVVELLVELTRPSALITPLTNTEVSNTADKSGLSPLRNSSIMFCFYWRAELSITLFSSCILISSRCR